MNMDEECEGWIMGVIVCPLLVSIGILVRDEVSLKGQRILKFLRNRKNVVWEFRISEWGSQFIYNLYIIADIYATFRIYIAEVQLVDVRGFSGNERFMIS